MMLPLHPLARGFLARRTGISNEERDTDSIRHHPFRSRTALMIAAKTDSTAQHVMSIAKEQSIPLNWITYDDVLTGSVPFEQLTSLIEDAPGIYFRQPWTEDATTAVIATSIESLVEAHENTIRPSRKSTNWCKPLHMSTLRDAASPAALGFPDSLVTHFISDTEPEELICKPISHMPAYARRVSESNWPTQFGPYLAQRVIVGREIRVHLIDGLPFALAIDKPDNSIDYRTHARLDTLPWELNSEILATLCELTASEGLRFAGIDLIISKGKYYVLEVNPMPGFHSYDSQPDWPITKALLGALGAKG